jgi:hypothetical protein
MDLSPKCTEETNRRLVPEHVVDSLQDAAILYPDFIEYQNENVKNQIWSKIWQIRPFEIVNERSYAIPIRTKHGGQQYIGFAISMVDTNTARIWEIGLISENQFLDFVKNNRAITT